MPSLVEQLEIHDPAALEELSLDQWQEMVASHPDSSPFHHRFWIELIADQYGFPVRIVGLQRDGRLVAGLPFIETRSLLGRRKLVSLPFTDHIRPLAQDEASEHELIRALCQRPRQAYRSVILRSGQRIPGVAAVGPWVRHVLDTDRPMDRVQQGFANGLRQNLRRAAKRGLQFESSTDSEALDAFYRLHLLTRRKLGVPIQPRKFFRGVQRWLIANGLAFVGLVKKQDAIIAAGVFLTYNKTMVYKYASSDPAALDHRPNECLIYHAVQMAVDGGYSTFDFGSSEREQEGLCRFKRKWGADELDLFQYTLSGRRSHPRFDSKGFKPLAAIIRNSPPFVCRGVGELFYRFSQ